MLPEIIHPHVYGSKEDSRILNEKCHPVVASVCYVYNAVEVG